MNDEAFVEQITQVAEPMHNEQSVAADQRSLRILVAEDHVLIRQGYRMALPALFPGVVIAEAGDAREALKLLRQAEWNLLLLDINLPGRSGLDLLHDVINEFPCLPVLISSALPEEEYGLLALKAGAAGYLNKNNDLGELTKAIKTVLGGRKYIGPILAEQLAKGVVGNSPAVLHSVLSQREFEVLRMLAAGKSLKEIGGELSISIKTVSTYRIRLLNKMGMKTNAELIRYAMQHLPNQ